MSNYYYSNYPSMSTATANVHLGNQQLLFNNNSYHNYNYGGGGGNGDGGVNAISLSGSFDILALDQSQSQAPLRQQLAHSQTFGNNKRAYMIGITMIDRPYHTSQTKHMTTIDITSFSQENEIKLKRALNFE